MDQDKVKKLNELLSRIEPTDENQRKIKEIKKLINDGNLNLTLKKIDELFSENNMEENEPESDIETNLIQEDTLENNEEDTEENDSMVVKQKNFSLGAPITMAEAQNMLDVLDHDFYIYTNAKTGKVNVIYRRKDGDLGNIEID